MVATLAIMLQPALVSLVGLENMSRALSVLMPAMGAGQFTAPPFAGMSSIKTTRIIEKQCQKQKQLSDKLIILRCFCVCMF